MTLIINAISIFRRTVKNSLIGSVLLLRRMFLEALKPDYLWIETTDRCNSRCVFCNIWKKSPTINVLSALEIEETLKDPVFKKLKLVVVSGGEPMLRNDIKEIIAGIHNAVPKAVIVLSSNGILNERLVETAKYTLEKKIKLNLGISLDSTGLKHDRIRGVPGLYQKIDSLFRQLIELKEFYGNQLNISAGYVLTDTTIGELLPVKKYVEKLGIQFNIQWYIESDYYENTGMGFLSDKQTIEQILKEINPTIINDKGVRFLNGLSIKFYCFSMFNFCLLKCNGDIVPCFDMWNYKIGNIRENTPSIIWRSNEAKNGRRKVKKCSGCLSNCGLIWSYGASFFPRIMFNLRHPEFLLKKLNKR